MTRAGVTILAAMVLANTASAARYHEHGPVAQRLPSLTPQPRSSVVRAGSVPLTLAVTVVTGPTSDPAAVSDVRRSLRLAGLVVTTARGGASSPNRLTVFVGRQRDLERRLHVVDAHALPAGGYALGIGRVGGAPVAVLDGRDAAGEYYAAQTFGQLVQGQTSLAAVAIRDWPSVATRGIVEGYYGTPWSQETRLEAIDFAARHRLNAYMYLPKDDPAVRAAWRSPLSSAAVVHVRQLVQRADLEHVAFSYGISPGDTICYSSAADRDALLSKLRSLHAAGVRGFTIALDDIDESRPLCESDVNVYGAGPVALASAQADLVNNLDDATKAWSSRALTFVPTEYSGLARSPYQLTLALRLHASITVQWTGRYGVSTSISGGDVSTAQAVYGHPVLIWDNYFVNDLLPGYLVLGPYDGRDAGVAREARGIVVDPLYESESARIGLATMADFAWNAASYSATRSWNASLRELAGPDPAAFDALRAFASANYGSPAATSQSPDLAAAFDSFWKRWNANDPSAATPLELILRRLRDAPATIRARLADRTFVAEARPWLDATQLWGSSALSALDLMLARRNGDTVRAAVDEQAARAARLQATLMVVPNSSSSVRVAGGTLSDFVHFALRGYGP